MKMELLSQANECMKLVKTEQNAEKKEIYNNVISEIVDILAKMENIKSLMANAKEIK